ncbi:hypothetical protein BKA93DRAFT_789487 [Sparassis latifolia]
MPFHAVSQCRPIPVLWSFALLSHNTALLTSSVKHGTTGAYAHSRRQATNHDLVARYRNRSSRVLGNVLYWLHR